MDFPVSSISIIMQHKQGIKRRYLWYVPGMISQVAMPVFFIIFIWKGLAERPRYHTMEVNCYNEAYLSKFMGIEWEIPKRQYLVITLTGNLDSDDIRINFGELYIKEIYANNDSVHGVDFHFAANSKYKEFVRLLDIANINNIRCYAPSDDGIKVFYIPERVRKSKASPVLICL